MSLVLWMAILGWVAVALLAGIIIGKGSTREIRPKKAEVWMPEMEPVGDFETEDEDIVPISKRREARPTTPTWAEDTVSRGVDNLRSAYHAAGMKASEKELRNEVMLMLNTENGEIE